MQAQELQCQQSRELLTREMRREVGRRVRHLSIHCSHQGSRGFYIDMPGGDLIRILPV